MRTLVVVGKNRAASIARERAKEVNPEVRIIDVDPADYTELSLDLDARALLIEDGDETKRIRFDALILADDMHEDRLEAQNSGRILPEFSFEVARLAKLALSSSHSSPAQHAAPENQTQLLIDAGAIASKDGTLHVDASMCTTLENVYACGSIVALVKTIGPNRHRFLTSSLSDRCAQVAGANAASATPIDFLSECAGAEIIEIGDRFFCRTGLSVPEIHQVYSSEDFARATAFVDDSMARLIAERESGAIVSAELVGDRALSQGINVLSLAIVKKLRASDLVDIDVPSLVRDAAQRLHAEVNRETQSISPERLALWMAEGRSFSSLDVSTSPSSISRYVKTTHLPVKELTTKVSQLNTSLPIIVSSESGKSALAAYRILKATLGQSSVFHLEGGARALDLLLATSDPQPH